MLGVIEVTQVKILLIILIILSIIIVVLLRKQLAYRKSISQLNQKIELLIKSNQELTEKNVLAEHAGTLKAETLANISHQIRTPINAIIGFSEFLSEMDLSEKERKDFSKTIQLNSDLLFELLNDFLDISLLNAGKLKIKEEKLSLHSLMVETYGLFKENPKLRTAHIDFTYFIDDSRTDLVILSDSVRIKQVLSNLIDNAIKFTDSGQISFSYKIVEIENKKYVKFRVDDSGIGIENKFHNQIFERFFRIHTDISQLYKGSGIGLYMVKSLVSMMGGDIWLTSIPNNGSTFFFTIPFIENKK